MKRILLSILIAFSWLSLQGQSFEIRLRNAGGGTIAVEMRETAGIPPTTDDFLTDLVFGICWPTSYGVSLGAVTTSYTIQKAGAEFTSGSTRVQLFAKDPNPIMFPQNWVTNQWVVIMTIPNNLAGAGFGTFSLCPTSIQELNININLVDFTPVNAGAATGVQIGPIVPTERIVAAEYFFDNDPGLGNGTPISITAGDTVSVSNLPITQCLTPGVHRLYVRGRDLSGRWGFYAQSEFTVDPVTIAGDLSICPGETTTLTASGGQSYAWSTGGATSAITVGTGGVYTVTVTGQNGCTVTASATVVLNAAPIAGVSGDLDFCQGQSSTLVASGGTSYLWSTGANTPSVNVNTANTYSVTATDANGCTGTASATVVVFSLPTAAISGDLSLCAGQVSTLTATGGSGYLWSTGATTNTVNITVAGAYSVTVTDANGCTGTASATATQNPIVNAGISGDLDFCQGQSSTLTATGGTNYSWSTGATTTAINVNTAGSYSVTATDANGCTGTASATVVVFNLPNAAISGDLSLCTGQVSTLTATGGTAYLWSTGAATNTINISAAGVYSVTATDANGCTDDTTVTATQNPTVTAGISGDLDFCQGQSSTLTASGGASYVWSTGASTTAINVNTAGVYSVTATDANGCTGTASVTVVVFNLPIAVISGSLNLCAGSSSTLTASGGNTYLWSTGATTAAITVNSAGTYSVTTTDANGCTDDASVVISQNPVLSVAISGDQDFCQGQSSTLTASGGASYLWSTGASTPSINVASAGVYSVTATAANGCTGTAAATVIVFSLPTAAISGDLSLCAGQISTLTATGGTGYLWSTGAATNTVNITAAGAYSVTVTDANGCTGTASATATQNPIVNAGISGDLDFCQGQSSTLTATGGTSYLWSTGATTTAINVNTAGSYSVTATDANGCTGTASVTVVVFSLPNAAISGDLSLCTGQVSTLTAIGGTAYLWSTGVATNTINISAAGVYSVTATDANGCTDDASVTATQNPTVNAGISGDLDFCQGQSSTLTASGGVSYVWSTGASTTAINVNTAGIYSVTATDSNGCTGTASVTVIVFSLPTAAISGDLSLCIGQVSTLTATGGTSFLWSTGAVTNTINVTAAGVYSVTVTDANGCTGTASVTATQNPPVTAGISGDLDFCLGQSSTLAASGGTSYLWSTGASTPSVNVNTAGTYSVTATDANGCTSTTSATVVVFSLPTAVISGDLSLCAGQVSTLTATSGVTYLWSTGATTNTINITSAGVYSVTATDANGCSDDASVTASQNPTVTASISGDLDFCQGESRTLTATGGTSYLWSTGATTSSINVNTAGTYTVSATDVNGCTGTATAQVIIFSLPAPTITGNLSLCAGSASTLSASGGQTYLWSTGATTASITVSTAGTYAVTATNANGCTGTASVVVVANSLPSVSITGDLSICSGEITQLTASSGASYSWSTGATTQAINVSLGGTYAVTVTDANGCSNSTSATVSQNPAILLTPQTTSPSCNGGSNGAINLSVSGGNTPFQFGWNTGAMSQNLTNVSAGNYSVTATDAAGCTAFATTTVSQPAIIQPVFSITPVDCNLGANGSVTLAVSGGTGNYTYAWSNGASTKDLPAVPVGSYTVTVTDANGCTAVATATVTIDLNNVQPLNISCPSATPTLTANTSCQASLSDYISLAVITGGCAGNINPILQSPAAGAVANPGRVLVQLSVTNDIGESASCTFQVQITGNCSGN